VIDVGQLFTSGAQLGQRSVAVSRSGSLVQAESLGASDAAPVMEDDLDRVSRTVNSLLSGADAASSLASLDDLETVLLRKALERACGNVAAAARLLGITRPQMVYRLKSRGIRHQGD
jgi:two-component system, NtrC family, response regulator HydG